MKLVADSNRIMAAIIRDSISREILLSDKFEFVAPEKVKEELIKYSEELIQKAHISKDDFSLLLAFIFNEIQIIPSEEIERYNKEVKGLIKDSGDIPFLSCALATKADGIWTEDEDFFQQKKIKIFRTKDLLDLI